MQPKEVADELDKIYEGQWSKPVLAIGCTVTGAGTGENRERAEIRPKGCGYLTFLEACYFAEHRYDGDEGNGYWFDYRRCGCWNPAWTEAQLKVRCPKLYEAIIQGGESLRFPKSLTEHSVVLCPVYLKGVADAKGWHRDSGKTSATGKVFAKFYPYRSVVLEPSSKRFGVFVDDQEKDMRVEWQQDDQGVARAGADARARAYTLSVYRSSVQTNII